MYPNSCCGSVRPREFNINDFTTVPSAADSEVGVCVLNIQQLQKHTEVADYNTKRESNVTGLLLELPSAFVLDTKLKARKGAHSNKSPPFLLPTRTAKRRHSSPGPQWSPSSKGGNKRMQSHDGRTKKQFQFPLGMNQLASICIFTLFLGQ